MTDQHFDAPSMEVLRGKCKAASPILGVQYQPNPSSPTTEFHPFAIGETLEIERSSAPRTGISRSARYLLREVEIVCGVGATVALSLGEPNTRIALENDTGWYTGFVLVLPDVTYTQHCLGLACRDCHLWDPCIGGGLPFGWFVKVTLRRYYLNQVFNDVLEVGARADSLIVGGDSLPREILSFNKQLYLPQTWKSEAELEPHAEEEY